MWLHALLVRVAAWLSPEQLRVATFLLVGGIGIGSNLAGMLLFRDLGDGAASVAGAVVGVLSNFVLHCRLTFRDRLKLRGHRSFASWLHLFAEFCLSSTVAVFAQLLAASSMRTLGLHAAVAQFGGILSGTLINFVAQNWCIFRAPPRSRERTFDTEEPYAV